MVDLDQLHHKIPADHPFLAFVNSVDDDGKTRVRNLFSTTSELADLMAGAGMAVPRGAAQSAALAGLLEFREAAYAVLSARAADQPPPPAANAILEAALKAALADSHFDFDGGGLRVLPAAGAGLQGHLALSLLDLTTSPEFERLSECRRCTRLFIDHGRGRGRRWCDMARCGNRAKAESFRARKRAVKPA